MADEIASVKTVVQVLNDGARGFADNGEQIEDESVKQLFLSESQTRATFASQQRGFLPNPLEALKT